MPIGVSFFNGQYGVLPMDSKDGIFYSSYTYIGHHSVPTVMSTIIGIIIGLAVLLMIAFPERFLPDLGQRKKRIGITHWGFYNGHEECKPEETMLVEAALPGRERVVAGSGMYAKGQGVKANASK